MHLKIVTVDKTLVDTTVKALFSSSPVGQFEILEGHTPLITMTVPTATRYITPEGKRITLFTSSGILKVLGHDHLFMVDAGELPEDIDLERAKRALHRAMVSLENASPAHRNTYLKAAARANARIKVAQVARAESQG